MTRSMTPQQFSQAVAAEVRAEMARQHKSQVALAEVLNVSQPTASRRLQGKQPFDMDELPVIAAWLGVQVEAFIPAGEIEATA